MSSEERIRELLRRYADNQSSEAEISEMLKGLHDQEGGAALESLLADIFNEAGQPPGEIPVEWETMWGNIKKNTQPPVRKMSWVRVAAAAMVITMLSVAGYFYFNRDKPADGIVQKEAGRSIITDAAPGGKKAILTLADGTQILLDTANTNGTLTLQGNTKIIKLNEGELVYNSTNEKPVEILFNTISTPKGGQYQVVLADGSKVWLNAASSLRFPTTFHGKERRVELSGEGYFEVEEDPSKPFIVSSAPATTGTGRGVEVKVLGTHFNVNSYNDEARIKVSLLKGSVQVAHVNKEGETGSVSKTLIPGEQAELTDAGSVVVKDNVDMDEVMAWKNGYFSFNNADLPFVMRQLARWYDVEVVYEGTTPKRQFEGKMERNLNLSQVLKIIEKNNVHFSIEGKTIIVSP
jgi:ferric-dicitrate binding protein FerR (iron transport regulator)